LEKKLVWFAGLGLALFVACSAEQGLHSRSPVSSDALDTRAASSVRASENGAEVDPEPSCTLTQGFWKNHPEAWPVETITIGVNLYTKEQALAILSTPPSRGDATYILAHQLIAAKLNVLIGADDSVVATAIADADAWLAAHPLGSLPHGTDRSAGIALAEILDQYNNGLIGPGHCKGAPPSPEPTPTPTPTPTPPA
jgi:hypothetical protein